MRVEVCIKEGDKKIDLADFDVCDEEDFHELIECLGGVLKLMRSKYGVDNSIVGIRVTLEWV